MKVLFAAAAFLASPVAAQGPSLEQLLARPDAAQIAAIWADVCLQYAGNVDNQRRASEAVDWPYQVSFERLARKQTACLVTSSADEAATIGQFATALAEAIPTFEPSSAEMSDVSLSADVEIAGKPFWISVKIISVETNPTIATIILAER